MKPRTRFLLAGTLILIFLKFLVFKAHAQTAAEGGAPARIFGDVTLLTDHIENGVTQTEHSFALQTTIGYKWPSFRMGIWGSNVKYPTGDDTLNLRLFMGTKLSFTQNTDLSIRYDFNRYYKSGDHNGGIIGLDLRFYEYHVLFEQIDNWEAAGTLARWGFSKDWNIPWNLILNVNAGYDMVQVRGLSNYFDVKTLVSYKTSDITYSLGNSYNSNASQFNGRGDIAFFLAAGAHF